MGDAAATADDVVADGERTIDEILRKTAWQTAARSTPLIAWSVGRVAEIALVALAAVSACTGQADGVWSGFVEGAPGDVGAFPVCFLAVN